MDCAARAAIRKAGYSQPPPGLTNSQPFGAWTSSAPAVTGITAHRPYTGGDLNPSTAWHPQFADVNNDGLLDLFVAKGNVAQMPDFAAKDPNNLLLGQGDGTFVEAGDRAGVASFGIARGARGRAPAGSRLGAGMTGGGICFGTAFAPHPSRRRGEGGDWARSCHVCLRPACGEKVAAAG